MTRITYAIALAVALSAAGANAYAGDYAMQGGRPTSGYGVPGWVLRDCHPATGAQMLARMAGPGQWFYRGSDDLCYQDLRPGVD